MQNRLIRKWCDKYLDSLSHDKKKEEKKTTKNNKWIRVFFFEGKSGSKINQSGTSIIWGGAKGSQESILPNY